MRLRQAESGKGCCPSISPSLSLSFAVFLCVYVCVCLHNLSIMRQMLELVQNAFALHLALGALRALSRFSKEAYLKLKLK